MQEKMVVHMNSMAYITLKHQFSFNPGSKHPKKDFFKNKQKPSFFKANKYQGALTANGCHTSWFHTNY